SCGCDPSDTVRDLSRIDGRLERLGEAPRSLCDVTAIERDVAEAVERHRDVVRRADAARELEPRFEQLRRPGIVAGDERVLGGEPERSRKLQRVAEPPGEGDALLVQLARPRRVARLLAGR